MNANELAESFRARGQKMLTFKQRDYMINLAMRSGQYDPDKKRGWGTLSDGTTWEMIIPRSGIANFRVSSDYEEEVVEAHKPVVPSDDELRAKLEDDYQSGKISQSDYDKMRSFLQNPSSSVRVIMISMLVLGILALIGRKT